MPVAIGVASRGDSPTFVCVGELPTGALTEHTPMYAASLTKQLIAVLAALAVESGVLNLDLSIRAVLPELPAWTGAVRVRHLVHHTSGLPGTDRLVNALDLSGEEDLDNSHVVAGLTRLDGLDRAPGAAFEYSNVGYVCLAEIVGRVGKIAVNTLARREIFTPLGMSHSRLTGVPVVLLPGVPPPPRTIGDGGLWTTASDLLRWLHALNTARLGARVARRIQTAGQLDDGTPLTYGWGMTVSTRAGIRTYTHGGNWPGWCAKTVRQPDRGMAVALLSCCDDVARISQTALDIADRTPDDER